VSIWRRPRAFSSEVVVEELDDEIFVRVLVCCYEPNDEDEFIREYIDCPVRVWLDAPVGDPAVIDADTGEKLPLHIPSRLRSAPG
jgi:hypothetical protein